MTLLFSGVTAGIPTSLNPPVRASCHIPGNVGRFAQPKQVTCRIDVRVVHHLNGVDGALTKQLRPRRFGDETHGRILDSAFRRYQIVVLRDLVGAANHRYPILAGHIGFNCRG